MKNTRTPLDCLPAIGAAVFVAMGVFGALQLRLSPTAHATEPAAHATESAAHANGPLHDAASTVRAAQLDMSPASAESLQTLSERIATNRIHLDKWLEKHRKLVEKARNTNSQLQFYGDSITEYMDAGGLAAFKKLYGTYNPENFGIGGDATNDLFWRINHGELGGHPKVMVIMIGTNDLTRFPDRGAQEIAQNIANIVKTVKVHEPQTKILLMEILPRDAVDYEGREHRDLRRREVNADIRGLKNGSSIEVVDIGDRFVDQDGRVSTEVLPDYLHPNMKGYEAWPKESSPCSSGC